MVEATKNRGSIAGRGLMFVDTSEDGPALSGVYFGRCAFKNEKPCLNIVLLSEEDPVYAGLQTLASWKRAVDDDPYKHRFLGLGRFTIWVGGIYKERARPFFSHIQFGRSVDWNC